MTIDQETFFENFTHIADAPNGVKKLRELILQLAVRGKLVPQDPNDEPAAKLLERIRAEKARLEKDKKIRKSDDMPPLSVDETPYEMPSGWEWVRLKTISRDCGQKVPDKQFTYIDVSAIDNSNGAIANPTILAPHDAPSRARKLVELGTVIYSTVRPYLLNIAVIENIIEPEPIASTAFAILHPLGNISNKYLFWWLRSPDFIAFVESKMLGVAYPAINDSQFFSGLFPLPPIAEQQRIVAKVDQLMALCDELEAKQQRSHSKLTRLNNAVLDRLTSACDESESLPAWELVRDNFDLLYTTPATIAKLRQSILQLAVQGKLVPQDPNDEPASVLLTKIKAEKEQLVKEKKIRKSEPLPPVTIEEVPYELPLGWKWVRFIDVANIASNLVKPESYQDLPHVAPDNIEKFTGRLLSYRSVHEDGVTSSNHLFFSGQVLYSKIRPNLSKVTMIDFDGLCSADMYPIDVYISPRYILHYMLSTTFLDMAVKKDTRVAMPKINQEELNRILVPICPSPEQNRIVVKVDQIMALCDTLEARLTKSQAKAEKLTSAAVQTLLAA